MISTVQSARKLPAAVSTAKLNQFASESPEPWSRLILIFGWSSSEPGSSVAIHERKRERNTASSAPVARRSGRNVNPQSPMVASPSAVNGGRVAKNTTYLTLALIGQKVLSALYIPIIAGLIGPSATGVYLGVLS